jgi:hypothetical protein
MHSISCGGVVVSKWGVAIIYVAIGLVLVAAGAQRGALEQQPVGAAQALVGEQLLETNAGAAVGPQVTGVDELLAIGFDQQRAGIGR